MTRDTRHRTSLARRAKLGFAAATLPLTFVLGCMTNTPTAEPMRFSRVPSGYHEDTAYFPQGDPHESVLMVRKTMPKEVRAGETFEYKIEVFNPTDDVVLKNVAIYDFTDGDLTLQSANPKWESVDVWDQPFEWLPDDNWDRDEIPVQRPRVRREFGRGNIQGGSRTATPDMARERNQDRDDLDERPAFQRPAVRWVLDNLYPEKLMTFNVKARANSEGEVGNCVVVRYDIATCLKTKVVSPDLNLKLDVNRDVIICEKDNLDVTVTVRNAGTGDAKNVNVAMTVPDGLSFSQGTQETMTKSLGTLKAGESKSFKPMIRVDDTGRYEITAVATAEGDLTSDNRYARISVRQGQLAIQASGPRDTYVKLPVDYTIRVGNIGDARVRNTVVTADIPAGMSFESASRGGQESGGSVKWNLGELGVNDVTRLTMRLRGMDDDGVARMVASANGDCSGSVSDTVRTRFEGIPAILVEVIDESDPIRVGDTTTYQIKVTNQGSAPENGIVVRCRLEQPEEFVSATGATNTGAASGARSVTFDALPTLASGDTATWNVVVRGVRPGDTRFKVEVDSQQHARPVMETEATQIFSRQQQR